MSRAVILMLAVIVGCSGSDRQAVLTLERHALSARGHLSILGIGEAGGRVREYLYVVTEWPPGTELLGAGLVSRDREAGWFSRREIFAGRRKRGDEKRVLFADTLDYSVHPGRGVVMVNEEMFFLDAGTVFVVQQAGRRREARITQSTLAQMALSFAPHETDVQRLARR